ncbi:MAG: ABC transporter ATP-binding protein [Gemmatimonadetes bacterium]|nr:ABC transporter ATP-binding protein [Gemmatimonadota bacterium]
MTGATAVGRAASPGPAVLELNELRTYFATETGLARAVDGVSFDLAQGETLGLVGESGCGKTVTALSILRLVPEPPGRIVAGSSVRFRGTELMALSAAEMRRIRGDRIAMIFQEPLTSLNPVFTVGDQIGETLSLHRGLRARAARQAAEAMLQEVGIPDPDRALDAYPHQLSGGMRQRVMIAMALSCEPDVLIADEPTTALDVTIQAQILELLAELRHRHGMAVLLITHDLGVVAEFCDRVAVMYAGQIVECGTAREVFEAPRHPYTQGLLASLPRLGDPRARLSAIPGVVPGPESWPDGCRFHDRCPHAWERCGAAAPPLFSSAPGRGARCWLVEEPARRKPGVWEAAW